MAKMDIQRAYRNIHVAPNNCKSLGVKWQSQVYVDKVLPFSLHSAPPIFLAIADALLWIMECRGVSWAIHYVDDFFTIGRPFSDECQRNMDIMHDTCIQAGLPLEPLKTQGPICSINILGTELTMEARLPEDKLADMLETLAQWRNCKSCKKRDLQSLIGVLTHASKVVKSNWVFLHRLSTDIKDPEHFRHLNLEGKSDIEWWYQFICQWNGRSIIPLPRLQPFVLVLDTLGNWGCGAYWNSSWF